jgi:hypothetical protein
MRLFACLSLLSLVLSACGDDAGTGAGGGSATSGAGGEASSTTGAGGAGSTSSSGEGGAGGGTGGGHACAGIEVGDGVSSECAEAGPLALGEASSVLCTSDPGVAWPVTVYAVEVEDGDCLYLRADDVGASAEADLFGAVVDPNGDSLFFDDESACSAGDLACFEGGVTIIGTGTAYVFVGAWESDGCPAAGSTPFELAVSLNGTDVALSSGPFCAGDLQTIIP